MGENLKIQKADSFWIDFKNNWLSADILYSVSIVISSRMAFRCIFCLLASSVSLYGGFSVCQLKKPPSGGFFSAPAVFAASAVIGSVRLAVVALHDIAVSHHIIGVILMLVDDIVFVDNVVSVSDDVLMADHLAVRITVEFLAIDWTAFLLAFFALVTATLPLALPPAPGAIAPCHILFPPPI